MDDTTPNSTKHNKVKKNTNRGEKNWVKRKEKIPTYFQKNVFVSEPAAFNPSHISPCPSL